MKTVILYTGYTINEESIFRYNILKSAADKLGYDLVWQLDITNYKNYDFSELNKTINFQFFDPNKLSKDKYLKKFEYRPSKWCNCYIWDNLHLLILYFLKNSTINYDYIWSIEYDVMYYGNWLDFFKQYENDDSDLVTYIFHHHYDDNNKNWRYWPFSLINKYGGDKFYTSLNCTSRMSNKMMKHFEKFYLENNINHDLHEECSFHSIAYINNLKIKCLPVLLNEYSWEKRFFKNNELQFGHLYHAIKLDNSIIDKVSKFYKF